MKKLNLANHNNLLAILAIVVVTVAVVLIILGLNHSGSPVNRGVQSSSKSSESGSGNSLCGFKSGTPTLSKLMIIWEENESDSSILGNSSLPYMNSLVSLCGFASNYWSYTHPSLPNYMAMTSGVSYASVPWQSDPGDCDPVDPGCTTSNSSVFQQLGSGNWKSYVESMSRNCQQVSSSPYAAKHNPAAYYTNISGECSNQDVPLGTVSNNVLVSGNLYNDIKSGTLPKLSTITPNLENDWHDGTASQADNWLRGVMSAITAGPDYQSGKLAVLVIFDEGNGSGNVASNTYAAWVSPFITPGTKSTTCFDDNSVTQTIEKLFNLAILNSNPLAPNCSTETSMISAFNL